VLSNSEVIIMHKMTVQELRNYNECQICEILKHKWIESEKLGHDVGELYAAQDWIVKYGSDFRKAFLEKLTSN